LYRLFRQFVSISDYAIRQYLNRNNFRYRLVAWPTIAAVLFAGANASLAQSVPDAPTIGAAVPANGKIWVNFTPPVNDGGSSILGYTATCTPTAGGAGVAQSGAGSPIAVDNLTNGVPYDCTVHAANSVGAGVESAGAGSSVPHGSVIAAGSGHTCALTTTGTVRCWGANYFGQLGNGTATNSTTPIAVSNLAGSVEAVSTGGIHSCALTSPGGMKCWGGNGSGQLGIGSLVGSAVPVDTTGLTGGVAGIAAGDSHTCALTTAGGVKCWGTNVSGQLGDGSDTSRNTPTNVVSLSSGVTAISAGTYHTCALTAVGGAKCWGTNTSGQLGTGNTAPNYTPTDVSGLTSGVTAISAGGFHTCAITSIGGVKCWGNNYYGQLGNASNTDSSTPVAVTGLTNGVTAISAGQYHTCALTAPGGVKCWGYNSLGQLGNGSTAWANTPVDVTGFASGMTGLAAGLFHTCAGSVADGAKCWGYNNFGQLGNGSSTDRTTPVDVAFITFHFAQPAAYVSDVSTSTSLPVLADYNDSDSTLQVNYFSSIGLSGAVYFPPGSPQQPLWLSLPATLVDGQTIAVDLSTVSAGTAVVSPAWITLTVSADRVSFTASKVAVDELSGTATIAVHRTGQASYDAASVDYSTADDTALAGSDYTATTGTLSWAAGELGAKDIVVPILYNPATGPDRQFSVVLSNPSNTKIGGSDLATVTIRQTDDPFAVGGVLAPGWSTPASATTGWALTTDFRYAGPSSLKSLPIANSGIAAIETAGNYSAGVISFARKVSSQSGSDYLRFYVDGVVQGEWSGELDWQMQSIPVSAGSHTFMWAYAKDAAGFGGLDAAWIDDVALPTTPVISALSVVASRKDPFVTITVTRDGDLSGTATVDFATTDGTGKAGIDYIATSGSVVFQPGDTTKQLTVQLLQQTMLRSRAEFQILLTASSGVQVLTNRVAITLTASVAVAAGGSHTCALTAVGGVKCWGSNTSGQLGNGSDSVGTTPVGVTGLTSGVMAISAGMHHTCALTAAGGAKCWGNNSYGQLGNNSNTASSTPADVTGLTSGVMAISAGGLHTCALTTAGAVKCWGHNSNGQLGDGSNTASNTAVAVTGLSTGVMAISAGGSHTCALTAAGAVKCWGDNFDGQLGDGSYSRSGTAVGVTGLSTGVMAISAGGSHTCALTAAGGVKCWGYNYLGQLGNGTNSNSSTPVAVSDLASGVTAITAGGIHTCALTAVGGIKCWGFNYSGQLGDGSFNNASSPVAVTGLAHGMMAITAGNVHTCALNSAGGLMCWGDNGSWQLGDGTPTPSSSVPVTALAIAASAPPAPTGVGAVAGNGSVTLSFNPSSAAGLVTFAYATSCTSSNGGASGTKAGSASPITISGLTNGKSYTCTVAAVNAAGTGMPSVQSNSVTPQATTPGAPTITRLIAGRTTMKVYFAPPAANGGAKITGYTATCTGGGAAPFMTGTTSPITVTGLTAGVSYTCSVIATNDAGSSSPSAGMVKVAQPPNIVPLLGIILTD
jgi:alpha-tubulin suppressor-like RCC1 family protein